MKALLLGETAEAAALLRAARAEKARRRSSVDLTAAVDPRRARAFGEVREADFSADARRGPVKSAAGLMTAVQWDRFRAVIEAAHPFDVATRAAASHSSRSSGPTMAETPASASSSTASPDRNRSTAWRS